MILHLKVATGSKTWAVNGADPMLSNITAELCENLEWYGSGGGASQTSGHTNGPLLR
jgi:hypothetical protein